MMYADRHCLASTDRLLQELVDFQRARISEMEDDRSKREIEIETMKRVVEENRSKATTLQNDIRKYQEDLVSCNRSMILSRGH